jgi:hypothetical protein
MSKRNDYEDFLRTAIERATVSNINRCRGRGANIAQPIYTESTMSKPLSGN